MNSFAIYFFAAIAEISGCFAFWIWFRLGKSPFWAVPGIVLLIIFAFLLTKVESLFAGRAFAAYGGIYIFSSLAWMWVVEGVQPNRWDLTGAMICIIGSVITLISSRSL